MDTIAKQKYDSRLKLMNDAIAMQETERVPVAPFFSSVVQRLFGSSYRDLYYDFDRAGQAAVDFYTKYPVDACTGARFTSGKAQEICGINIIDWPGKPGTVISDYSSHQVREIEYLSPEECYEAMLKDFDGFYMRHYIPRVYDNLKELENLKFAPRHHPQCQRRSGRSAEAGLLPTGGQAEGHRRGGCRSRRKDR